MRRLLAVPGRFIAHLRNKVVAGILIIVPALITYLVLRFLFEVIDDFLQPAVRRTLNVEFPGAGFIATLILLYLIGVIGANIAGRRVVDLAHWIFTRLPIIQNIYKPSHQLVDALSGINSASFKRVVVVDYPREGLKFLGFVTGQLETSDGDCFLNVYVPTSPTPQSGWLMLVKEEEVIDTNLTIEQAMQMILSGGLVSPSSLRLSREAPQKVLKPHPQDKQK